MTTWSASARSALPASSSGDITVDASLNPAGSALTVAANTAQAGGSGTPDPHAVGSKLPVERGANGHAFVRIRDLAPSEVLVLVNHPETDPGEVRAHP